MSNPLERRLEGELEQFIRDGVYKRLNFLDSPQAPRVRMEGRGDVIILSSNNYLGLSAQPEVVAAGKAALDRWGAGTASVRFICGTFTVHRTLEAACARLVGTPAALSFVSCWNANEAVPGTLLGEDDIVISDQLNHASIIDGVRLAKAITKCQTAVYKHADLADLEQKLTAARDRRVRLVITDGVFSMEGAIAKLPDLLELCRKHQAVLMVDDSHATGVLGAHGRGTAEHFGMVGDVDIITSTLGKALGGAAGGFVRGLGRDLRLPDAAGAAATLLQRAPAHRRGELARGHRVPRGPSRAGDPAAGAGPLLPRAAARARLQAAAGRDADHPRHPGRDLRRHPDERPAAGRRGVRHRLRVSRWCPRARPGCAARSRRRIPGTIWIRRWPRSRKSGKQLGLI